MVNNVHASVRIDSRAAKLWFGIALFQIIEHFNQPEISARVHCVCVSQTLSINLQPIIVRFGKFHSLDPFIRAEIPLPGSLQTHSIKVALSPGFTEKKLFQ